MIKDLLDSKVIAIDTETATEQPERGVSKFWYDEVTCLTASTKGEDYGWTGMTKEDFWNYFEGKTVIFHNASFDLKFLRNYFGGELPDMKVHDTMIMQGVLDNRLRSLGLKQLCEHHLGVVHEESKEIKKYIKCMQHCPYDLMFPYAMKDTRVTYDLAIHLMKELKKVPELLKIYEMEMEALPVVVDMEYRGHRIDVSLLEKFTQEYTDRIEELKFLIKAEMPQITINKEVERYVVSTNPKQYYRILSEAKADGFQRDTLERRKILAPISYDFNPQSTDHIAQYMLDQGYEWDEKTDSGKPATSGKILEGMANIYDDTLLLLMMELRRTSKVLSTYFVNIKHNLDEAGYVHCSYKQVASSFGGTDTGRFSCSNPNLQNLPTHNPSELYMNVKKLFIPDSDDSALMFFDYASQEMRLMAHFSGDAKLLEFVDGDMHQYMADKLGIDRSNAKAVNYAMLYGAGPKKILAMLGLVKQYFEDTSNMAKAKKMAKKESSRIYRGFWEVISTARDYKAHREAMAVLYGYTTTRFGRRRYIDSDKAFTALNGRIQGTSGDLIKLDLIKIGNFIKDNDLKTRVVNTIHDELVLNVPKSEAKIVRSAVVHIMEGYEFSPVLKVDVEWSLKSWADKYLKKLKEAA